MSKKQIPLEGKNTRLRAAMYVRMSTDHQKYSTENQADAILEYAARHNMEIVRTYTDGGKSGLSIEGRYALQELLEDVRTKKADYTVVLVLDVTRWGRFQDADQSAYYEYSCRKEGVAVEYVAEQFENDGSPVATIVKGVKRAMAGEYSRELSNKVFAGQCRLIELGYRQGGPAGFGLRRMLIDEHGTEKGLLKRGEHKSIQTDRVILVPGPDDEIQTVRRIYRYFVHDRMPESQIAALLNQDGILTDLERPWTGSVVHEILINEKYIGNNVFNRSSYKLKVRRVDNTPDMWIRANGVFQAIVDLSDFLAAQNIIHARSRRLSDDEILDKLKTLKEKKGWLSGIIINETENMPSSATYAHRFGSLIRAYQLIGYTPDHDYSYIEINRALRAIHADIVTDTIQKIENMGGTVERNPINDLLRINDEIMVSLVICRCTQTEAGSNRWKIRFDTGLRPDITIAIRMDTDNKTPLDYYFLPALDIENPKIRLADHNSFALEAYRFNELSPFFRMIERSKIAEVA